MDVNRKNIKVCYLGYDNVLGRINFINYYPSKYSNSSEDIIVANSSFKLANEVL